MVTLPPSSAASITSRSCLSSRSCCEHWKNALHKKKIVRTLVNNCDVKDAIVIGHLQTGRYFHRACNLYNLGSPHYRKLNILK